MMKSSIEPIAWLRLRNGLRLDKYLLAEETKCNHRTAQRILQGIHKLKATYIAGWQKIYNQWIPYYSIQPEERKRDKPRPAALTPTARARKRRKNPEARIREAAAKKAKRQRDKHNGGTHMKYELITRVRQILAAIGPAGARFVAGDVSKHFTGVQRRTVATSLQRLVRQGEITIAVNGNGHGKGRVYAIGAAVTTTSEGRRVQKTPRKLPAEKKAHPAPAWSSAWPMVWEGFKQRHEVRT